MRIVLAGGGTAGHISPMLATAEALMRLGSHIQITCVGTPIGLETTLVPQAGFELRLVDPIPLPRTVSINLASLPARIVKAVRKAELILRQCQAEVVVGFGGYASLPTCLAARRLKIPVVVHEANMVPGLSNRIAARFAAAVCVTFAETDLPKQIVTGMPVRRAVAGLDRMATRQSARSSFGLDSSAKVLLVSGGSQGARILNDATVEALPALDEAGISVLHVTGARNYHPIDAGVMTKATYVCLPYVDQMEQAYAAADLMLARSGAGTVVETALVGLPAILVPLPHGNGEQAKNAAGVVAAGAAILIDNAELSSARLADEVIRLFSDQSVLTDMSLAGHKAMQPNAAGLVARQAISVAKTPWARR